jgi:hypothetical protein
VKCRVEFSLAFPDEETARAAADAVLPENEGWIEQRRDGARLEASAEVADPMSLLRTADDWLAAVTVAEKAARAARNP